MRAVITPEESDRIDALATAHIDLLMERAGYAVAVEAAAMGAGYGSRVAVLCGPGNNGGDGYVAARHLLRRGAFVTVYSLKTPSPATAAGRAMALAESHGVRIVGLGEPEPADLIIDAVFGVGLRDGLPEALAGWIRHEAPVLAIDLPSGLDAASGEANGPVLTADRTITFHALKPAHILHDGPDLCGEIVVADIGFAELGITATPELMIPEEADAPRPARNRHDHKWSVGSVVVIGGYPGLTGAPLLAARSALAMGAGAVTLMCPAKLQGVYASQAPEIMTRGVGAGTRFSVDDVDEVLEAASRFDVMVLGPGLGIGVEDFVRHMVLKWPNALLIDADGLNALPGIGPLTARQSPTVMTPHAREFTRITGRDATYADAVATHEETGAVVLLKGAPTFVAGELRWAVTSGGPELATIGTGDVLAGAIAALWARGLDGETAALSGAYWHGRAGASLAEHGMFSPAQLAEALTEVAW